MALRWKGRIRYTVPYDRAAQDACWEVFRPGWLGVPLRAMTRLPRISGSIGCSEGPEIESIKRAIGGEASLSCCRAGAAGVWSKDTVLLLDSKAAEAVCFIKAGAGAAVDSLLQNEANWLRRLRREKELAELVPELLAHRRGEDLCFVAQRPLCGKLEFNFGAPQLDFLKKLQASSTRWMPYEDSQLFRTLRSRVKELEGHLSNGWSARLATGMRRIGQALGGPKIHLVGAHCDFTPWNIRLHRGVAKVFDWEYAADEQLPLFDPLHFVLLPMALRRPSTGSVIRTLRETIEFCKQGPLKESCYAAQAQTLAYLVNVAVLYLWSLRGDDRSDPIVDSYGRAIDHLCAWNGDGKTAHN